MQKGLSFIKIISSNNTFRPVKKILQIILSFLFFLTGYTGICQEILINNPPRHYICYRTAEQVVTDGQLNEKSWESVPWTEDFIDIEGKLKPLPYYQTKVKLMWEEDYLYIGAWLQEPDLWATLTERESVIFKDNDFEVFIDPDGDTHNYYEIEVNALGTVWDLMLTKPYAVLGVPKSSWNADGLRIGVHLSGTINNPTDTDTCWSLEMAVPFNSMRQSTESKIEPAPQGKWRINFSRVQWRLENTDGKYKKSTNRINESPLPELNWVWSPQWAINMHKPEYYGYLQFSDMLAGTGSEVFIPEKDFRTRVAIRELFDAQYKFFDEHHRFTDTIEKLKINAELLENIEVKMETSGDKFRITARNSPGGSWWSITEDSRIFPDIKQSDQ